ncbi:hypothetical protein [Croceicoccus sp. YJ47]|uniref:hypothetical protein n=1 Tax=Croceicoccus sp. YJ47 TaxID=2798724 RepID=UPI001922D0B9|nr:hypothetical protein [Croceicoccus sp. YJ47]QQN73936.1 hypothetical protein JD971_14495 [Croceicoccus sp. YJ47]
MSVVPFLRPVPPVPIIHYDEGKASRAYMAYLGVLAHGQADPDLAATDEWEYLRQCAYRQFEAAYAAGGAA